MRVIIICDDIEAGLDGKGKRVGVCNLVGGYGVEVVWLECENEEYFR